MDTADAGAYLGVLMARWRDPTCLCTASSSPNAYSSTTALRSVLPPMRARDLPKAWDSHAKNAARLGFKGGACQAVEVAEEEGKADTTDEPELAGGAGGSASNSACTMGARYCKGSRGRV